jgi:hypothetical protein
MGEQNTWVPANDLETRMAKALRDGDMVAFVALLTSATLVLPITESAAQGHEPASWAVVEVDGQRCLPVFTSPEIMLAGTQRSEGYGRRTAFRDLVAAWPDPSCVMVLNPSTPLQRTILPEDLILMASRPITDVLEHPGDGTTPAIGTVVQKFLSIGQALDLLERNDPLVSGYVVRLDEIAHLNTLDALMIGLCLPTLNPDITPDSAAVCALRWLAAGAALYPIPCAGPAAEHLAPADGWVMDDRPGRVAGFVEGAEPAVQLYKVQALRLPDRAELVQMTANDLDLRAAWYDADQQTWMLDPSFIARARAEVLTGC